MSVRWTATGGDSAVRFHSAVSGLPAWRRIFRRCTFQSMDAMEFLEKVKDVEEVGIYCDPPFPGPGDAYKHQFRTKEQILLANVLATFRKAKCVCRFYDHALVRELYPESIWRWRIMEGGKTRMYKAAPEVLLVNDKREI